MDSQSPTGDHATPRRPLKTRQAHWPHVMAAALIRAGLTPNQVSILSIFFAGLSAAGFLMSGTGSVREAVVWLVVAAVGIQLRLLCNLLDGLMAVEGGLQSRTGNIYNDLPDRISDSITLIATGYAIGSFDWRPPVLDPASFGPTLGWAAALLAALTAYIRLLGAASGTTQHFTGPMAKQQRMGLLTVVSLFAAVLVITNGHVQVIPLVLSAGLAVIVLGSFVTCIRRLRRIVNDLNA